jgi:hypothetical protein
MDIQDDKISNTMTDQNTPTEHKDAFSPKPRKKRVAINSPEITPPQTTLPTAMEVDEHCELEAIKPTVLAHRFQDNTLQEQMTPAQVKATLASDQWKEIWEHPQIFSELTADPVPPTPGEVLPYDFDQEDTTTTELLLSLNRLQLEHTMRDHVMTAKNQDRSRMHPKFSPFTLRYHEKDTNKAVAVNSKGERAYTFKLKDLKLETEGTNFDLNDSVTYSTICSLTPILLWKDLQEVIGCNSTTDTLEEGPYRIVLNKDNTHSISFQGQNGTCWRSSLSTDTPSHPDQWNTVTRGLKRPTPQIPHNETQNALGSRKQNRYSILADDARTTHSLTYTSPSPPSPTINTSTQHTSITDEIPEELPTTKTIKVSREEPTWVDDSSDGEATHSGDEKPPHLQQTLSHRDIRTQITSPSSLSALSSVSDPHAHSDGENGQYLINVELQLVPGQEHTDTLFQKTRDLLTYIQQADPTAAFLSRTTLPNGKPHPALSSPTDKHWPTTFLAAQNWVHTSMDYLFKLPPITEHQLQARLSSRQTKEAYQTERPSHKPKTNLPTSDKGPVALYITMRLRTNIPHFDSLLTSVNIDLRKLNIKVSRKTLQTWDSKPRKFLCSVNSNLCVDGVKQLLLHQLKEMEKRLCRHGKRSTVDWYDTPLPDLTITLRGLRPLRLPKEEEERKTLTFEPFPWDSKLVYHIEADDMAWQRLEPLLDYLVDTNILAHTFGPAAYLLDAPNNYPSLDKVRAYHKHGRISIGYNLATTVLECNDVQIYDYDVKVAMEETDEIDEEGIPTGIKIKPKPPYTKTNLRKELQRIRINGEPLFHTAVMTCKGPDAGTSRIVMPYNSLDPLRQQKYNFAKTTVTNLACFMYHWWIQCGYNASTRHRLMRSFYLEKAQLAEYSTWDHLAMVATPQFTNKRDTYLNTFGHYDPSHSEQTQPQHNKTGHTLEISDEIRASLIKHLGNKHTKHDEIGSQISGVSAHTGESNPSTSSTVNTNNSINRVLKTKDMALQLASSKAKQAEQEHLIASLKQQMEQLQRTTDIAESQTQQGAPHLSGSGAPPPDDPGSGEAPQGL